MLDIFSCVLLFTYYLFKINFSKSSIRNNLPLECQTVFKVDPVKDTDKMSSLSQICLQRLSADATSKQRVKVKVNSIFNP